MERLNALDDLISRYPGLMPVKENIREAADCLTGCYQNGGKVLVCGNGGSSADSDHIVGELMKGFEHGRPLQESLKNRLTAAGGERGIYLAGKLQQGLPAISLPAATALITAVANDTDPDLIFAQQVVGYGIGGDVLIGISSSGNSQNVIDAMITARAKGLAVIGLTGESGGKIRTLCDILINVPGTETARIQELHLPVYHTICRMVEDHFFRTRPDEPNLNLFA